MHVHDMNRTRLTLHPNHQRSQLSRDQFTSKRENTAGEGEEGALVAGRGEGEEGVLSAGREEEKGRSPPAAAKERRGCSPPATRRREGVLVADRGEEKGGSVLTILTNTEVWSSVSKVGKFSYSPIPWK